ncbi:MAG: hypothetical protein INR71_11885, partial [Terriglobus roseus]|nr:hypothetical protein [Terriglobus roseus]
MSAETLPADKVEPTASPLPPAPEVDPLSPSQWRTLMAFADAVIPDIAPKATAKQYKQLAIGDNEYSTVLSHLEEQCLEGGAEGLAKEYLAETPSKNPKFKESVYRFVGLHIPEDVKRQLTLVFSALDTRAGALLLTGYPTAVADQPVETRQKILLGWFNSRIPILRTLAKSLTVLCKRNWLQESPSLGRVLNFPRIPKHGTATKGFPFEFLQFTGAGLDDLLEARFVLGRLAVRLAAERIDARGAARLRAGLSPEAGRDGAATAFWSRPPLLSPVARAGGNPALPVFLDVLHLLLG